MMLLAVVAPALISAASLKVKEEKLKPTLVPLLRFDTELKEDGSYEFVYEGGDGSSRSETSHLSEPGTKKETLEVSGSYRYLDHDGKEVVVHYTAGKNGFVPVGTNIAKEISEAAKLAADTKENYKDYEEEEEGEKEKEKHSMKGKYSMKEKY